MESKFSWNCLLQIKPLCIWERYTVLARHINKTYDRGNISKYTELLLVTASKQSAAQGNTWGCLNHLNTFSDYLGDLDDMEDYTKTSVKCKIRKFFNTHFESFASYATATITKENGNHL